MLTISEQEPGVWSINGLPRQTVAALACALHEFDRPGATLATELRPLRNVLDGLISTAQSYQRRAGAP